MKNFFYDTEFLEGRQRFRLFGIIPLWKKRTPTIDLISLGVVTESYARYRGVADDSVSSERDMISKNFVGSKKELMKSCSLHLVSKEFNLREAWYRYDWKKESLDGTEEGTVNRKVFWIRENVLWPIFCELTLKYYEDTNRSIQDGTFESWRKTGFNYKTMKYLINRYGKTTKEISNALLAFTDKLPAEQMAYSFDEERRIHSFKSDISARRHRYEFADTSYTKEKAMQQINQLNDEKKSKILWLVLCL